MLTAQEFDNLVAQRPNHPVITAPTMLVAQGAITDAVVQEAIENYADWRRAILQVEGPITLKVPVLDEQGHLIGHVTYPNA